MSKLIVREDTAHCHFCEKFKKENEILQDKVDKYEHALWTIQERINLMLGVLN